MAEVVRAPGLFYADMLDQTEIWIDVHGRGHKIDEMPLDYVENVIWFLRKRPGTKEAYFCWRAVAASVGCELPDAHHGDDWLEYTPLMLKLISRL